MRFCCHKVSFCWECWVHMNVGRSFLNDGVFPMSTAKWRCCSYFVLYQPTCQLPGVRHVTPLSGDSMADMHVESRNKSRCSSS